MYCHTADARRAVDKRPLGRLIDLIGNIEVALRAPAPATCWAASTSTSLQFANGEAQSVGSGAAEKGVLFCRRMVPPVFLDTD